MIPRRLLVVPVALVAATVLAACGSSSSSAGGGGATSAAPSGSGAGSYAVNDCATKNTSQTSTAPTDGQTVDGVTVAGPVGQAPVITVAAGAPVPGILVSQDLVQGTGKAVPAGATVTANYCGVGMLTGTVFDSSWANGGQPISFALSQVIPGWTKGLPGMKVGGRRLLIIPSELGYGAQGYPPAIQPNEALIFVIDLTAVS